MGFKKLSIESLFYSASSSLQIEQDFHLDHRTNHKVCCLQVTFKIGTETQKVQCKAKSNQDTLPSGQWKYWNADLRPQADVIVTAQDVTINIAPNASIAWHLPSFQGEQLQALSVYMQLAVEHHNLSKAILSFCSSIYVSSKYELLVWISFLPTSLSYMPKKEKRCPESRQSHLI